MLLLNEQTKESKNETKNYKSVLAKQTKKGGKTRNWVLHSIFWSRVACGLNAERNATKSLKFNPSTILSNLWGKKTKRNNQTNKHKP